MIILSIFLLSIIMIFFVYFGYPLTLLFLEKINHKRQERHQITPMVTLIITAFNEGKRIRDKLENSLNLSYPSKKLQIIVASDGSTDLTNQIVQSYFDKGIELVEVQNRGGKENAQKEAMRCARGDVIVFSDVTTFLEPRGLQEIVSNFADPSVGCVSSEDRLVDQDGKPSGEGIYIRYEMWLRRLESRVNSLVGLSGSFFAARKEVCQDFSGNVQSDFRTLLSSMKLGMRGVADPKAIGYYRNIADEKKEFDRKVRTVLRGMTVFFQHLEFLNFFKYGLFSYQFFCHKLLRWLVPYFLFAAFFSNIFLAISLKNIFLLLMFMQLLFYGVGIYGFATQALKGIMKIPMYFMTVNLSIAVAWVKYLTGKRVVLWNPSER